MEKAYATIWLGKPTTGREIMDALSALAEGSDLTYVVQDLIVMGYSQDVCVRGAVQTALNRRYQVHTSFDTMQGSGSARCEIFVDGASQGKYDPCTIHEPSPREEVRYLELGVETAQAFYASNTHLAKRFTDLPISRP